MKRILIACTLAYIANGTAAEASHENVLYSFCSQQACADGSNPYTPVIEVDGVLYGTTASNGTYGRGTVYSLDLETGAEKTLHAFGGGADGYEPVGSLIEVNGVLYGATEDGGTGTCRIDGTEYGCGTVFAVDPKTGKEAVVYSFQFNRTDAIVPFGGLVAIKGILYGTTMLGGTGECNSVYYGCGTVFSLNPKSGAETVLYSFQSNGADGVFPYAALVGVNGSLYGVTEVGGAASCGCGTVFSFNPARGAETVLHSFSAGADGQYPDTSLIDVKGTLYGTTEYGGNGGCDFGCGTVFSVNPNTGAETVQYAFQDNFEDGINPGGGLTNIKGTIYGIADGGTHNLGVVFSLNLGSGIEKSLFSFYGRRGKSPTAGLISVNGNLYGTTSYGGFKSNACGKSCGTVFSIMH